MEKLILLKFLVKNLNDNNNAKHPMLTNLIKQSNGENESVLRHWPTTDLANL